MKTTESSTEKAVVDSVGVQPAALESKEGEVLETSDSTLEEEPPIGTEASEETDSLSDKSESPSSDTNDSVAGSEADNVKTEVSKEEESFSKKRTGESATLTKDKRSKGMPVHEMVGGSSARQFLNKHLTSHLLEGVKMVERERPDDPLLALGEFLIKRSSELGKITKK